MELATPIFDTMQKDGASNYNYWINHIQEISLHGHAFAVFGYSVVFDGIKHLKCEFVTQGENTTVTITIHNVI